MKKNEYMSAGEFEKELHEFNREREQIKEMLGRIGGTFDLKKHKIFNWGILTVTVVLFVLEMTTHFLPTLISLEIGLLLISVKIILLIQSMLKQNHFEFWILNTIEYRINDLNKRVIRMEKDLRQDLKRRG